MKKRIAVLLMTVCIATMGACGEQGEARGSVKDSVETSGSEAVKDTEPTETTEPADGNDAAESADTVDVTEPTETAEATPEPVEAAEVTPEIVEADDEPWESGDLVFDTVDIYGNPVTDEIVKGSRLVLLNLWEPWCGPCVREIPDLEELYEAYKEQGLLILGAYTSFDMDADAKEIVDSVGVTYPVLKADRNLYSYEQSYVPATFLFDGSGNLLDSEPIAGSRSYDEWESIILEYLAE